MTLPHMAHPRHRNIADRLPLSVEERSCRGAVGTPALKRTQRVRMDFCKQLVPEGVQPRARPYDDLAFFLIKSFIEFAQNACYSLYCRGMDLIGRIRNGYDCRLPFRAPLNAVRREAEEDWRRYV
jgi:hypothetical protein